MAAKVPVLERCTLIIAWKDFNPVTFALDMRDLNNRLRVISFTLKRKSKPHDIDT